MRHPLHLALLVLALLSAGSAHAQPFPECPNGQLFLRWDDCHGDGGVLNKAFACNTNSGQDVLVVSMILDEPITNVNGVQVYIDVASSSGAWPNWWAYSSSSTTGCRGSLAGSFSFVSDPDWTACQNLWPAGGFGATGLFAGYHGAGTRQLRAIAAVPAGSEFTIPAGVEVFVCRIQLGHAKTVGTGACAGCEEPMCFVLSEVELSQATPAPGRAVCGPHSGSPGQMATWQGAAISDIDIHGVPTEQFSWFTASMICSGATPTRQSTWGAIKSFYR